MGKNATPSLMEQVLQRTESNVVKKRSGSGKTTYLDRFVDVLLDSDGNPTEPKTRVQIVAEMSYQIISEQLEADVKSGKRESATLDLTEEGTSADDLMLADINNKCKNQVASAVARNNNSTSLSYNDKYKDKWHVVKDGNTVALAAGPAPKE